jgi:hypothetical protein
MIRVATQTAMQHNKKRSMFNETRRRTRIERSDIHTEFSEPTALLGAECPEKSRSRGR